VKYACFDIGNVLYHIDFDPLLTRLSKEFNVPKSEAYHFLNNNQKRCDLGISLIAEELTHRFSIKSDVLLKELTDLWMKAILPEGRMLTMLEGLQKEGVQIALLSNMGHEHQSSLSGESAFEKMVKFFSCLVGARKPTLLYYSTFLHLHPKFKGALYIDDLPENLAAGADFGFLPFHFALDKHPEDKEINALRDKILQSPDIDQ